MHGVPRRPHGHAARHRQPRPRPQRPRHVPRLGAHLRAGARRRDAAPQRPAARSGGGGDGARIAEARADGRESRGPRRAAHPAAAPHAPGVRLHHRGPAARRRGGRPGPVPDAAGRGRFRRLRYGGGQPEHVAAARAGLPRGGRPDPGRGAPHGAAPGSGRAPNRVRRLAVPAVHRAGRGPGPRHRQEGRRRLRRVLRLRLDLHVPQRHRGLRGVGAGPLPGHRGRLSVPGGDAGHGDRVSREDGGGGRVARRADRRLRPGGAAGRRAHAVPASGRPDRAFGRRPRRSAGGLPAAGGRGSLQGLRRHEGLSRRGHRVPDAHHRGAAPRLGRLAAGEHAAAPGGRGVRRRGRDSPDEDALSARPRRRGRVRAARVPPAAGPGRAGILRQPSCAAARGRAAVRRGGPGAAARHSQRARLPVPGG